MKTESKISLLSNKTVSCDWQLCCYSSWGIAWGCFWIMLKLCACQTQMRWSMMMLSSGKRAAAALWTTAGAPVSLRATRKPVTPRMDMERTASQMPLSGAVHPARKHMYVFMLLRSLSLFPSSFSSAVSLAWTADMQCNRSIEVCVCQCNEIWCLDHRLFTFAHTNI